MPGKIFYKEREKVEDGAQRTRFRAVAVSDCNLKIYSDHLRLSELQHIAREIGAELILLEKGIKKAGEGKDDTATDNDAE